MLTRGLDFTSCTARTLGFSRFQQTQVCERVERELGGTTRRQPTSHALTYAWYVHGRGWCMRGTMACARYACMYRRFGVDKRQYTPAIVCSRCSRGCDHT